MWLATSAAGVAVLAIPGTPRPHLAVALVLAGFAAGWGVCSLWLGLTARTMTIGKRAIVTAMMMPIVALALWATGGARSYLQPVLLFTALFIAYFFPPRLAWPLVALFSAAFFSPMVYDPQAIELGYPARGVLFLVAVAGQALTVHYLKHRLLQAEAVQRGMAERDPLTSLYNRRSFDDALERATADGGAAALVLFDFDGFKAVNDDHGHPTGDAVLRAVAEACARVVRDGDYLARIGGDEFALVAPGAAGPGVERIVEALATAIAEAPSPEGVASVRATFASAVAPHDAGLPGELFRLADQRLLARKRELKRLARVA
ncbi:MAG TPA: GGDEF domain-containing protein [Solirubrobacteraceae bacterium]|nr:GGDEF domain-containing protein [Solirubrobacteraceae bacterium]